MFETDKATLALGIKDIALHKNFYVSKSVLFSIITPYYPESKLIVIQKQIKFSVGSELLKQKQCIKAYY